MTDNRLCITVIDQIVVFAFHVYLELFSFVIIPYFIVKPKELL